MVPGILAGALLVYVVLVGGSESGQFLVTFQVLNGVIGLILVALWIGALRHGSDTVDLLVVGGLVLFLLACAAATYPRQSFDAATGALTWTAAFGLGRRLLAVPRYRLLCIRLLGVCGLTLAGSFAVIWGAVWLEWIQRMGSVPPLDLTLPPHIYRHYYVVAILLASLLPASVGLLRDRVMRLPAAVTITLTVVLITMSGSRAVWLGLAIAGAVALAVLRPPRRLLVAAAAAATVVLLVAFAAGIAGPAASRLFAGSTVTYRFDIWQHALELWASRPLNGIGPGSIGIGLTLSDLTDSRTFLNRHADNAFIQLAAEAGIAGLGGGLLALFGLVRGAKLSKFDGRVALLGLVLLAAISLTNNPTDSPNVVAITVCYAALLAPISSRSTRALWGTTSWRARGVVTATWITAIVVAAAVTSVNVAAILHSTTRSSVSAGKWAEAADRLGISIRLDPSMALYHRERGVLLWNVSPTASVRHLQRAVALNPADVTALRALALQASRTGNATEANDAALLATKTRPLSPENWVVLALVSSGRDATAAATEALRLAPWLAGSPVWPSELEPPPLLAAAAQAVRAQAESPDVMGASWLSAATGTADVSIDPTAEALRHVLGCELDEARASFASMGRAWVGSTPGIVGRIMLARLIEEPEVERLIAVASLRQPDLGAAARGTVQPYSVVTSLTEDPQLYRRTGLGPLIDVLLLPRQADALGHWMAAPREAAARALPGSPLASGCP